MIQYRGDPDFEHGSPAVTGVLLANLGTPDSPTTAAVRRYLNQFLSDPRVIELPRWLWLTILHGAILRFRPARSAAAYRKIWTDEGSPLLKISERLTKRLGDRLGARDENFVTELGMAYGNPSIPSALDRLLGRGARRLIVVPLYPQYSATTTGSVFDQVTDYFQRQRFIPELTFVSHYHDRPGYIHAVADSIRRHWQNSGRGERLLFSFHGIPKRYLLNGDPYHCECLKTARLVSELLELGPEDWFVSFQSRIGREEWLRPYTDETFTEWGRQGIGDVDVVCPGFAIDCLETLEEIAMQNRDIFSAAGGGALNYIPCLNDSPEHAGLLADLVLEKLPAVPERPRQSAEELSASCERALSRGASR